MEAKLTAIIHELRETAQQPDVEAVQLDGFYADEERRELRWRCHSPK
jgi:hypothetical protein